MKDLGRHQFYIFTFNVLHRCCLQSWDLNIGLLIAWRLPEQFGGFHVCPLASKLIKCYQSPKLDVLFGDDRYLSGALSLLQFSDFIQLTFMQIYILGMLYCIRFPHAPSNDHQNLVVSFHRPVIPSLSLFFLLHPISPLMTNVHKYFIIPC